MKPGWALFRNSEFGESLEFVFDLLSSFT
jgi:hypothetical protein